MESVNFVVLGDQSIATDFGKKGTSTDLTLYDRKESKKFTPGLHQMGFQKKFSLFFRQLHLQNM